LCIEFQYDSDTFDVTPEMQEVFDWDGCFIVRYSLTDNFGKIVLVAVILCINNKCLSTVSRKIVLYCRSWHVVYFFTCVIITAFKHGCLYFLCIHYATLSAKAVCFCELSIRCVTAFVHSSGQILLPRYLMNGFSMFR